MGTGPCSKAERAIRIDVAGRPGARHLADHPAPMTAQDGQPIDLDSRGPRYRLPKSARATSRTTGGARVPVLKNPTEGRRAVRRTWSVAGRATTLAALFLPVPQIEALRTLKEPRRGGPPEVIGARAAAGLPPSPGRTTGLGLDGSRGPRRASRSPVAQRGAGVRAPSDGGVGTDRCSRRTTQRAATLRPCRRPPCSRSATRARPSNA